MNVVPVDDDVFDEIAQGVDSDDAPRQVGAHLSALWRELNNPEEMIDDD